MDRTGVMTRLGVALGLAAALFLAPATARADVKAVRLGVKGAT